MLSIIIPTLNEAKYLPRLLESIKQQSHTNYEIIVSDGQSDDQTLAIAQSYGCRTVVSNRRLPAVQRNAGAKIAQGELLFFLDADSYLSPDFLTQALAQFNRRQLGLAGFYLRFDSKKKIDHLFGWVNNCLIYLRQFTSPIAISGILVQRVYHEQVGGFDEVILLAEDYDYCRRVSKLTKFGLICRPKLVYSIRRLDREGRLIMLGKWLLMGVYTLFNRPIKKKIIKYDFGQYEK